MALYLAGDRAADELLETDAFALLIGMVLDQQVPMARGVPAPFELRSRLNGELTVEGIAAMPTEALVAAFSQKPALHRFPAAMAERTQLLARTLLAQFDGDAAAVWERA